jgi:ribosomal protein S27AE
MTPERFRQIRSLFEAALEELYAQMSDEQLTSMADLINGLTDSAQEVLRAEISRRGLDTQPLDAPLSALTIPDLTTDGLLPPESEDDSPDDADYVHRCPKCGSGATVFQGLEAEPASGSAADKKYRWTCDACGHIWKDDGIMEKP